MLGEELERFKRAAAEEISSRHAAAMLSPTIHPAYQRGVERLKSAKDVIGLAHVDSSECGCLVGPALFSVVARQLLADPDLAEEVFGQIRHRMLGGHEYSPLFLFQTTLTKHPVDSAVHYRYRDSAISCVPNNPPRFGHLALRPNPLFPSLSGCCHSFTRLCIP